jgi:phosphopantetheinyl transferase (holo-ACP synthase)
MPLYKEWEPNEHALAAVWHIGEEEAFFGDKTGLTSPIRHPKKRLEHLCGRYLLQHLREDFPLHHIAPDEHDKPRLPENRYYFSISHSYPYVAAVISDKEECGIDIQVWKDNIAAIAYMFLSEDELALCSEGGKKAADTRLLTLAWCAKEAVYKWNGRRGAEFIRDLPIQRIVGGESAFTLLAPSVEVQVEMQCFGTPVSPASELHKDFALSCLVRQRH